MNQGLVDQIAAAVLYEGYILYPYRPSVKNRKRWTFGGLVPRAYSQSQGVSEPFEMQTECLVAGSLTSSITMSVRFLQLVARLVGQFADPLDELPDEGAIACPTVELLQVGDEVFYTWQEAIEQRIDLGESSLVALADCPCRREFALEAHRDRQPLCSPEGKIVGALVRERNDIEGLVETNAAEVAPGVFKVTVKIENRTPVDLVSATDRDEALLHGLVSTHTVLGVRDGEFMSLIDPPAPHENLASLCRNVGCWPVLVGEVGDKDTMLSAPIILYDYPQIAPESPGELFDGTEIDEILTLRIMTLTDQEKQAMAAVDQRARAVLARTESLDNQQMLGLHGTFRGLRPR
jgi:hydrogenase maturation protease